MTKQQNDKLVRENAYHIKTLNKEMGETRDLLSTVNEEITEIKLDNAMIKTDMIWIKKFFWIVATASVGGLVTGILNLMITTSK